VFNGFDSKGDIGDKEASDEEKMIGIKDVEVNLMHRNMCLSTCTYICMNIYTCIYLYYLMKRRR
jgi:hypothetical protein